MMEIHKFREQQKWLHSQWFKHPLARAIRDKAALLQPQHIAINRIHQMI